MLYRFGDCELDDSLYQLRRSGKSMSIEPKVFGFSVRCGGGGLGHTRYGELSKVRRT